MRQDRRWSEPPTDIAENLPAPGEPVTNTEAGALLLRRTRVLLWLMLVIGVGFTAVELLTALFVDMGIP